MRRPPSMNQVLHLKINSHISHEYAKVRWHQFGTLSCDLIREKQLDQNNSSIRQRHKPQYSAVQKKRNARKQPQANT